MATTEFVILIKKIRELKSQIEGLKIDFKHMICDKNLKLENRWLAFKNFGEFILDVTVMGETLTTLKNANINWDDFEFHRHETVSFLFVIELLENRKEDGFVKEADLGQLKEEILETGYYGFIYDW